MDGWHEEGRHPRGQVVVGLDTHDGWQRPLDWAVQAAVLEGRELTVVHAADAAEDLWRDAGSHESRVGVVDHPTAAQLLLDEARARALAWAPELRVHELLHRGGPREVLTEVGADAHLLVVGSRDRHRLWPRLVGGVSGGITRRPPCAVVVVHDDHPGRVHRGVLVGVDDTEHSQSALRFAFEQASLHDWPLTVLHVAPEELLTYRRIDRPQEHLHLANALAGASEDFPDVPVQPLVEYGEPSGRLLHGATGVNLVVVGAHHGRSVPELLTGSVVGPVVAHARCAVAVVPHRPR